MCMMWAITYFKLQVCDSPFGSDASAQEDLACDHTSGFLGPRCQEDIQKKHSSGAGLQSPWLSRAWVDGAQTVEHCSWRLIHPRSPAVLDLPSRYSTGERRPQEERETNDMCCTEGRELSTFAFHLACAFAGSGGCPDDSEVEI